MDNCQSPVLIYLPNSKTVTVLICSAQYLIQDGCTVHAVFPCDPRFISNSRTPVFPKSLVISLKRSCMVWLSVTAPWKQQLAGCSTQRITSSSLRALPPGWRGEPRAHRSTCHGDLYLYGRLRIVAATLGTFCARAATHQCGSLCSQRLRVQGQLLAMQRGMQGHAKKGCEEPRETFFFFLSSSNPPAMRPASHLILLGWKRETGLILHFFFSPKCNLNDMLYMLNS